MKGFHPNIILIKTAYVHSYLFKNGKNSMLVDTGKDRSGKQILQAIEDEGLQPSDIRLIVLTHPHYDHCKGVPAIKAATGARLLVQKDDEQGYRKGHYRLPRGSNFLIEAWVSMGRIFTPWLAYFPAMDPDIVMEDEFDLKEFGIEGKILHTPGHTRGSVTIILEGKHAIAGDTLYGAKKNSTFPPFADLPEALVHSWKRLIEEGIEYVYPGHGTPYRVEKMLKDFENRRKKYGI